jgi:hypothetical protein
MRRVPWIAALLALLCGGSACDDATAPPAPLAPVLVVGVDGFEWDVMGPLLARGELPHLAALAARGHAGLLETLQPTASPVIWTSVATGKGPAEHGIRHFARRTPRGMRLYDNGDRRTKALWNIASDDALRSAVVGWWMTHPVEPIRGVMVAQTNTLSQLDTRRGRNIWKGTLRRGVPRQVHPPERQAEMLAHLEATAAHLPERVEAIFGRFPHPLSPLGETLWQNCQWAFRADATYLDIFGHLIESDPPYDLMMLYLGGPDVVGHRFWRYMEPERYRDTPPPRQIENFSRVIPDYYRFVDRSLGAVLEALPAETTVLVLSDHGMHAVRTDARFDPDRPPQDVNSAEHQDAPPGVLIAAGPGIGRPDRPVDLEALARRPAAPIAHVFDVAPTVLTLLDLPVGEDMRGRVLEELFSDVQRRRPRPRAVASHDTLEFLARRPSTSPGGPSEQERLEQLRALGYLRDSP